MAAEYHLNKLYALASPVTHVTPNSPPTLLIQGEHDQLVPVAASRALYQKLLENRVPVAYIELPQTEHTFDIAFPGVSQNSPAGQAALYEVERFLFSVIERGLQSPRRDRAHARPPA